MSCFFLVFGDVHTSIKKKSLTMIKPRCRSGLLKPRAGTHVSDPQPGDTRTAVETAPPWQEAKGPKMSKNVAKTEVKTPKNRGKKKPWSDGFEAVFSIKAEGINLGEIWRNQHCYVGYHFHDMCIWLIMIILI